MSLFRFKDWWSVQCATDEHFGHHSLCVTNVDNSIDGCDKIIVASLSGVLRIFSVGLNPTEDGLPPYQASDLLMEMDFKIPILQVSAGLLLSATTNIQLAVLHPKKLSIYSVSSTAGVTEHGSSYNILLIYEHLLQKSAFQMTLGPFGHIRGKDFLCVESLDGNLSFFEQESMAFNRYLPNSLLPSAMAYIPQNDSFVFATSLWTIESYRYQVLAIAKSEDDNSQQISNSHVKSRKVNPDWSLSIGESVVDIKVVVLEKSVSYLMVLGERNLFAIKDNGSIWFMKKFDFNASCLTAYPNDTNDAVMSVVANYSSTLVIFCNDRAVWATQLPFTPVALQRTFFPNLSGAIVCLSDEGNICCGYLGTNPSIKIVSVPNSHLNQINYPESESELQELRKVINSHNLEGNQIDSKVIRNDLKITICDVNTSFEMNTKTSNPLLRISIQLETTSDVSNVKLAIQMHNSLVAEPNIVTIPSMSKTSESVIHEIVIYKESKTFAASTKLTLVATYTNEDGAPRVTCKLIYIPINILTKVCQPFKDAEHRLNLVIENDSKTLKLSELFSDLLDNDTNNTNAIGLEMIDENSVVSISTSTKANTQRFALCSDSFGTLAFVVNELLRRLAKNNVKYDLSQFDLTFVPLNKLFALIDEHLMARHQVMDLQNCLSNSASQFRSIQKRLLIKLKDRNPSPLNNLDTLLKVSQTQINEMTEKLIKAVKDLHNKNAYLSSGFNLIFNLLVICSEVKSDLKPIQAIFTNYLSDDLDEGWEERTELALITLLDSYGKQISNARKMNEELSLVENSDHIKRLINVLIDRVFKRENSNNTDNNDQKHSLMNQTIAEDEE